MKGFTEVDECTIIPEIRDFVLNNNPESAKIFDDNGVNNQWLPLTGRLLRRLLPNMAQQGAYKVLQQRILTSSGALDDLPRYWHIALENGEELMSVVKTLGDGGHGIVEAVRVNKLQPGSFVCVRKQIQRFDLLDKQKRFFEAFRREINIMRRVSHQHCVQIVGSYTDNSYVAILSLPVADTDLHHFMDLEKLSSDHMRILCQGIGCICGALAYLHGMEIRHEDLKPHNILLRGEDIFLTDFGISMDFSEKGVSTTYTRPHGLTARYAAPEVHNGEARSRATDIYSLGCVIFEMILRLCGWRMSNITSYWEQYGTRNPDFARNYDVQSSLITEANSALIANGKYSTLMMFTYAHLLLDDRNLRPSVVQILDKLEDIDRLFSGDTKLLKPCCMHADIDVQNEETASSIRGQIVHRGLVRRGDAFHERIADFDFLLLDFDRKVLARGDADVDGGPESDIAFHFRDPEVIKVGCKSLIEAARKMAWTRELWKMHSNRQMFNNVRDYPVGVDHARATADISAVRHSVLKQVWCIPRLRSGEWSPVKQMCCIFLMPIRFPKVECFSCFFFKITFEAVGYDA